MKIKAILSLALLGMVTAVNSAPYSATGAGSSTIGTTGTEDYASLNAAVLAINAAATRDASTWTFLINTDLSEPNNSFLGVTVDPAGAIVFKPAPTTAPVITFTRTSDNPGTGVSGNFIIGTADSTNASIALSADTPTRNITIDGSNTVGGTTRDLTITNSSTIVHSFSSLVVIAGDSDNITVKNTNIINANTGIVSSVSGISVRPRYETPNSAIPDNTVIENNLIRSIGSQQGVAINVNSSGVATGLSGWVGYSIKNNTLEGRIRGIFMNPAGAGNITGNTFNIGGGGTTNGFGTFGVIWNGSVASPAGVINVLNNDINVVTDNHTLNLGPTGLFLGSLQTGAVINVVNNEISVESNPTVPIGTAGQQLLARGIFASSGLPFNIYNNSIRVKGNANITASQNAQQNFGIGGFALASTNPTLLNNVVSVNIPGAAVINQNAIPTTTVSNYNILNAGASVDTYARRRAAFTFHNRSVASGVATISTGNGTTAQAHTLAVGDQVVIAPTITFNMHNRAITGGVATISTGSGTTAQAHTLQVGETVFVNSTVSLGGAPNVDLDGARTVTAVTPSSFSFATSGADLAALVTPATVGNLTRQIPGVYGGPFTLTAVTGSSFSYSAGAAPDVAALGTAATQGNVWIYDIAAATVRFPSLAAWQTASSQDANSDALDPDVAGVAPDTGKWTSASSLRLDGKPGLADTWGAPPVAALADATAAAAQLTDIDGQTRATGTLYRGADELVGPGFDLPVTDWAMY